MKKIMGLLLVFLVACEKPAPEQFALTSDGVRSLLPSIATVVITPQADPGKVSLEIQINKAPSSGGAQEWNSIADDLHYLSRAMFAKPEIARARIGFASPQNRNLEWAVFFIDAKSLPKDWGALTYLQFFGLLDPMPGTLEAGRWLCDFYKKYNSATPGGKIPQSCAD